MNRHAAAAAVVLCLCPAWLFAQNAELVVNSASANVHKAPTTASPVIDTAPRGTVLDVTRNLGSWVRVSWPDAPDGVGYVHVSAVTTARRALSRRGDGASGSRTVQDAGPATPAAYRQAIDAVARHGSMDDAATAVDVESADGASAGLYIRPPRHVVGLGGLMSGSTIGYGISARAWPHRHLGVQVDVSRYALTSPATPGRQTSVQFAPSVLYRLSDRVTDYVWVRPYFGAGATLHRQSVVPGVSDSTLGYQAFGGGEFTFASVPRFALSADVGYRWSQAPIGGLDLRGMAFSFGGRWYFR